MNKEVFIFSNSVPFAHVSQRVICKAPALESLGCLFIKMQIPVVHPCYTEKHGGGDIWEKLLWAATVYHTICDRCSDRQLRCFLSCERAHHPVRNREQIRNNETNEYL